MYLPPAFAQNDPKALCDLIENSPFGLLIASGPDGPEVAHLPFVLDRGRGNLGHLRCHVAGGNMIWQTIEKAPQILAVFTGPQAYVSPDWYQSPHKVPTWNYVAVHVRGAAQVMTAEALEGLLQDLSAQQESQLAPKRPWTVDKMPAELYAQMRQAIVGIDVAIEGIAGKWKLSQDKSAADRLGVVGALRQRGGEENLAVAEAMAALSDGA